MSQGVTHVEGFQKSNRKFDDQRICNQMVKNGQIGRNVLRSVWPNDRKYNQPWTGSTNIDHGKQISKRNVCEVVTIT